MSQFIEMFKVLPVNGTISDLTEGFPTSVKKTYGNEDMIEYIDISSIDSTRKTVLETSKHFVGKAPSRAQQCVKNGDILVSTVRPVNRNIAVIDNDIPNLVASTGFCVLRPKEGYRDYLLSVVTSDLYTEKMCDKASGGLYPAVNNSDVLNYGIHIPDEGLANRVSIIYKQADKSKFGDFKSQFIEMFGTVESYCKLDDLVSDTFPGEWGCEPTSENAIKVIRTTNFTNEGHLDLADIVTRDIESKKVARKKLKQGDTILERSGGTKDNPVGRVVFFDEIGDYLPNNFTQVLRPKEFVNPVYLFYALYNSYNINKAAMRAMASQTTGIQNLSMSDFMAKSIVLPSRDEQNKFEQIYRQADKSKSVIQKALVYLNDIQSDELGKIA